MKRFSLTILAFLVMSGVCFGAGTLTGSTNIFKGLSGSHETMEHEYTITFAANSEAPYLVPLSVISNSSGNALISTAGWWLGEILSVPGSTPPSPNTTLRLWLDVTRKDEIDILNGNGLAAFSGSTARARTIFPTIARPLTGDEVIQLSANSAASATCKLIFKLYR